MGLLRQDYQGRCFVYGAKGQGVHPNDDHPEGQNRQRRIIFEIWYPKTILKYIFRGAIDNLYFCMQLINALKIIE